MELVYEGEKHLNSKLKGSQERENELSKRKQRKKKESKNFDWLYFEVQIIDG
jgi:hypothetical protein